LNISVSESGTIKSREQIILKNEVEGRTTILFLIPEGTKVKEGELLVELDASKFEDSKVDQEIRVQNAEADFIRSRENLAVTKNQAQSDIDKAELAFRFAKEDLVQYKEGEFPKQEKEIVAKITLAEEEIQRAEETAKWSRVLFGEKYLSQSELQGDELTTKRKKLELELAQGNLALLRDFTYKRRIAEMESDIKQAEMALERVTRKASADVVQAEAQLRARESEFSRQKDKLAKIGEQIKKTRIVAPAEGLVVYATSAKASWRGNSEPLDEGQDVRERQELIYLPTASLFMAEIKVHESNLDKISLGMPARITVDALPGKTYTASVAKIAPLPDAQSMFMNPDLKIYRTQLHVDGGGGELRTGMNCRAEIGVASYGDTVYVPVQAVLRVNGVPTVFIAQEDAEPIQRQVEVGLDNNRMVRIAKGLELGEKVMLTPPLSAASTGVNTSAWVADAAKEAGTTPPVGKAKATSKGAGKGGAPGKPGAQEGKARKGAPGAGRPDFRSMTPEQREAMRKRFENMTPEQRAALRKKYGGGGGRPQGGARPGGGGE
ncbi:MAG: HlyD family efflux transporter periplasmic adaptor subunit, partial [Lentisphaerae bacterium]|nr:HlyD family efflux transporter periplasmic adaptor subunit [Lentisphaerota bacterium]